MGNRTQALLGLALDTSNSMHVQAGLGYSVPFVASALDLVSTIGAPCDGVQVDDDDFSVIYAGADGQDTYPGAKVGATPSAVGTGWTDNGNGTYTHTGGGGTATLDWTLVLTPGAIVLVKYTVSGRTAGSVTASAGGTAGAATSSNTSVRELITTGATQTFAFTPTTDFDGTVSLVEVLPRSPKMKSGVPYPLRCRRVEGVLDAAGAESATTVIHLQWYRKV